MMGVDYGSLSPDGRWQVAEALLSSWSGVLAEVCELVRAVDAAGDWRLDGVGSLQDWLAQAGTLSAATARDVVRTAQRLGELPALSAALGEGRLSWDQVRPAARLADPDTDERLAEELVGVSPASIDLMARARRPEPNPDRSGPWLRRRRHASGDGTHYSGFLPAGEAAAFDTALDRLARQGGPDPDTGMRAPIDRRRGDALCELVAAHHAESGLVRMGVTVHTDAAVADHGDGAGRIGLSVLDPDGVNRALCDADLSYQLHDGTGRAIGIGRLGRDAPAWLAQRVVDRDLTCRFPGCERPIRQLHHVTWWSKGGETNSDSLVGLCWTDHGHMHTGGWNATGNADSDLVFTSPRGKTFLSRARPEWTPPRTTPPVRHTIVMHLAPSALAVNDGCDDGCDDGDDHGCESDSESADVTG